MLRQKIFKWKEWCFIVCGLVLLVTIFIAISFHVTLYRDLNHSFCADLYVLPANDAAEQTIAGDIWADIALDERIADVEAFQKQSVLLDNQAVQIIGIPFHEFLYQPAWVKPPLDSATNNEITLMEIEPVYASKNFARQLNAHKGDFFSIPTPTGKQSIIIIGIFKATPTRQPTLAVERSTFSQWFGDYRADYLAVLLKNRAEQQRVIDRLNNRYPALMFYPQKAFLKTILRPTEILLVIVYCLQVITIVFFLLSYFKMGLLTST